MEKSEEKAAVRTFNEQDVEASVLRFLEELGWDVYGLESNQWGAEILDSEYDRRKNEAIYWNLLRKKLIELNEEINEENVSELLSSLARDLSYENILEGNENFLKLLRKGKPFTVQEDGEEKRKYVDLIDFDNIEKNSFIAINQFTVRRKKEIRPDVVLLVNGIPLVIGEAKSKAHEKDYRDAVDDLADYEEDAPRLFIPALLNFAVDETAYRYGATGADPEDYNPWREAPPGFEEFEEIQHDVSKAIHSMFNRKTLLDILQHYVFYGQREGKTVKIVPRYMQYIATEKIIKRVRRGKYKRGLIWHTQGSGKSFTMFFTAYKIQKTLPVEHPKVIILVDRDNLNEQMKKDLYNLNFPNFEVAKTSKHLERMLSSEASRTILTTIQKFADVDVRVESKNVIILSDEAHRFLEKKLGSKLEAVLPNAYNFGFTGTPVRERDRNTFRHFTPEEKEELYLHRYSIAEGIDDRFIIPVYFELEQPIWDLSKDEMRRLDIEFEGKFSDLSIERRAEIIRSYVTRTDLAEIRPRVRKIVKKINEHYERKLGRTEFKGMVVTPSRRAAAIYKEEMDKERNPEETAVIYSGGSSSDELVSQYYKSSDEIDEVIEDFEEPKKNPQILIVCQMLLTGFDAPTLKVMYLDRPLKDHNLLQAIARTNRPREGKYNGLIVDFQRVFENLDEALDYNEKIQKNAARSSKKLKQEFEKTLNDVADLFDKVDFKREEALAECLNLLNKNPERREKFKEKYRKLQDLYETITPDEFLVREDIESKYKQVGQIYVAFRRQSRREERPERNLRRNTLKLIEEHTDIEGIKDDYPVYKVSSEHLKKIDGLEPAAKAAEIAYATQRHIKGRIGRNPRYIKLSERLQEVTTKWQEGEIEDQVAAEKLSDLEREAIELKEAPKERGMRESEYAIFTLLQDEYRSSVGQEKEMEKIARGIGKAFKNVNTDFPEWDRNENVRKKIRREIIDVLSNLDKLSDLYKTGFLEDAIKYLIENERMKK